MTDAVQTMNDALAVGAIALGMTTLFTGCALSGSSGQRVVLAENGTAKCTIVLADQAIEPEQTAASELADYLKKVAGAEFTIVKEGQETRKGTRIYVGPTKYARKHGIDMELLGPERWYMRTSPDGNLILAGGRPRGTIYAVYHFLEDVIGVRWWSPWEEHVPSRTNLSIAALDRHGKPVFQNRCLDTTNALLVKEPPPFTARNRINREISNSVKIPFEYGGGNHFGPPSLVHTEGQYYAAWRRDGTLKKHPEWIALKDGKRQHHKQWTHNQLCLSNLEMRKEFLRKLRKYIRETRNQPAPPMIFDVSLNDVPSVCECGQCQAVVKKYGGVDTGLLLDFVNYLADGIKDEYPGVMIETLAYLNTERIPRNIVPRANVIITLCDTKSTYTKPIAHDGYFAARLRGWSKITNNIFVWDYHTNFADMALPMPYESTFQADLQLFRKYKTIGYMTQFHFPIYEEMRDLRLWLLAKLLEDPYQDQNLLIGDFTDGFYGPAAVFIREYLALLQQAAAQAPSALTTGSRTASVEYLTPDFVSAAQKIFDRAEQSVRKSDVLLRRVRHARMGIDKATVTVFPRIWQAWVVAGNKPADIPFDREKIAARIRQTVEEQYELRAPGDGQWAAASYKQQSENQKKLFLALIDTVLKKKLIVIKLPSKFSHLPESGYTDYPADSISTGWVDLIIEDADSEAGITIRKLFTDQEVLSQTMPATGKQFGKDYVLSWDMHNYQKPSKGDEPSIGYLKPEEVKEKGYHWYKMGRYRLHENNFLWVYNASLEVPMRSAIDPLYPGAEYDIWARIKFEGLVFPHGKKDQANAVFIERIVVLKAEKNDG